MKIKYLNKKSLQSFQGFTACDMISRNLDDEWEIDQFQGKGVQILRWCYLESTNNNDYHTNEDLNWYEKADLKELVSYC